MSTQRTLFVGLALVVGSMTAGALVSSAVSGDGAIERVLPATEEAVPVLAPVALGPDGPPAGEAGGGSGSGAESDALSVIEPVAIDPDSTDGGLDPGLVGVGAAPSDPVEPRTLPAGARGVVRGPRFEDPCSVRDAPCAVPGVGGTVLGGAGEPEADGGVAGAREGLHDAPPLWVRIIDPDGPGNPWTSRCDPADVPRGELPLTVVSLNPADLAVEIRPEGGHVVSRLTASSARRSHPEHRRWRRWFDAGTLNSTPERRVQHCLAFPDRAAYYVVSVTATDVFGQVATHRETIVPGDPNARPGTIITPVDDTHLAVRGAALDGQTVRIRMVPAAGEDATSCSAVEDGGFRRRPGEVYARSGEDVLAEVGEAEGTRYAYTVPQVFDVLEGRQYWVCLWWTRPGSRSFDPERIDEREQHAVAPPNHWALHLVVEGITPNRDIEAGGVEFEVEAAGRPVCRAAVDEPLEAGTVPEVDLLVCDPTVGGRGPLPDFLPLNVTGPEGKVLGSSIHVPDGPCDAHGACHADVEEWYAVRIPNQVATRRLCGRVLGGEPDPDCVTPSRRESAGTALLHATFVHGEDVGGVAWDLGSSPSSFPGTPTAEEPLPVEPRLDLRASSVVERGRQHELSFEYAADRPVTVRATVTADTNGAPCLRGGDGTVVLPTAALTGGGDIAGLCANTRYAVTIVLTDPSSGATATYGQAYGPSGLPWANLGRTAGFAVTMEVRVTFRGFPFGNPEAFVDRHTVRIDGSTFRFLDESERPIYEGRCVDRDAFVADGPFTVGDEVRVSGVFHAFGDPSAPCGSPPGHLGPDSVLAGASLERVVSLDALLGGGVFLDTGTDEREDTLDLGILVRATPR